MGTQAPRLVPALVLSAVAVLVAALGSLLYTETAAVQLSIPPHRLQADATINGGPNGPDLKTQHVDASLSESQQGTASTNTIAPTYASGQVTFRCERSCTSPTVVAAGQVVATAGGTQYETQTLARVPVSGASAAVPIRALSPGAAGNAAPGTVAFIVKPSFPNLSVTNTTVTGGADARTEQVIQQSDFDAVANALTSKVTDDLNAALKTKVPGMTLVQDGPPTLNLSSDYTVGDKTTTFRITVSGSLSAVAFSEDAARGLLRSALEKRVPAGYQLTSDPIQTTYQILRVSSKGNVTLSGSAVGFIAPTVSAQKLANELRGMSVADARKHVQRAVPGAQVDIKTSPPAVYWMPLVAKNIKLTVVIQPASV
jgi:hypothetical protein